MAFKFDVVISGISGRFPECDDIDTFKRKLYSGNSKEFINSIEKKWTRGFKLNRYGDKAAVPDSIGKYTKEIDFDYRLFKFNQLFGRSTDVLNRKILEPSFEAIVDAGINPYSLDGANVGVFMTGGIPERDIYCVENIMNHVFVLGNARTMAPNRLSYALNLRGPSYAFHTDPLGGFEALKVAQNQISDGTIEAAVVAVASNVTDPKFSYLFMYLDLLSYDKFCRPFDKKANGFIRSESAVVFFLQREEDAKRQYAKLLLCDNIFEGLSPHTLLGHDEDYVRNSLRKIYERNTDNVSPEDIAFVELTGCAVKRFELAEANAVADVLCKHRTTPLMVGSAKSSVGHTEAASGFLSILKTLLALDSQIIAPNSNLSELNDDIRAFREKQMQVVSKKTELPGNIVAVNTVGLWGAVHHVILQNNARKSKPKSDNIPRLLLLSGRTIDGLRQVFKKIEFDSFNPESIALANEVFQKNMPFHIYRGFTILPKTEKTTAEFDESGHPQRPICFIFSGMGSQWNGMGKELLDFPVIAEVIKRCDAVLKPKSIDIYKVLLSEDPTIFDDITMSFVGIICMQIALVEVLKKLNIVPDLILGHSVGENGCAYVDGCLTLEQAVLGSYSRGIVSTSTKTIKGMMAAIGKGYEEIRHDIPKNIEVACHNAVNSCTLSGPAEDIDAYVGKLKSQGVFAKSVNVANIAYHSKYIAPAAPKLLELLKKIIPEPKKRSSKWISSSIPETEWHLPIADHCSAEYLTNNLLKPVLFEEACKYIPKDAICIEIAPHGLLQAILKRSLPETCTNISLTLRSVKKNNLNFLLSSIGRMYIAGCEPAVNNLYPSIEYPVSRGTPSISPYCTWFHGDCDVVAPPYKPAKSYPLSKENIVVRINEEAEFNFLRYHQINESTIIPPTFFLYLVWRMLAIYENVKMDEFPILFEKITVHKNVKILISEPQLVNIMIQASGFFEILSRAKTSKTENKVILSGRVAFLHDDFKMPSTDFDSVESTFSLNADEINNIMKNAGFLLGECFQLLTSMKMNDSKFQGNIEWRGNWVTFLDSIMKFQMFSDLKKSKLCFLKSIRRMILIPSAMNSQQPGNVVVAKYCSATKCFQCNGIEIHDVKWGTDDRRKPSRVSSSLKIKKMRFVSYNNPSCQSLDEFVDICLQISLESLEISDKTDSKFYICDYTGKLVKNMRRSETISDWSKEKVIFYDYKTALVKSLSQHDKFLLIAAEKIPCINVSHLEDVYILLILSEYDSTKISKEYATILKQEFDSKTCILLKKKLNYAPSIRAENANIQPGDLSKGINNVEKEIVIWPTLNSTSLTSMFSKKKRPNTKYIFLSGNNEQWIENEAFMSRVSAGLPKILMKNQDWGSYRHQSPDWISSSNDNAMLKSFVKDIQIQSISVKYVRPDFVTPDLKSIEDLAALQSFGVEFSGVNAAGQKLMGLAMVNLYEPVTKLDPLLTWNIPEEWTLAEAAAMPLIYTHVFQIPVIIKQSFFMPTPTVLIIAGEDMLIIEICLSMCVCRRYTIYVVVTSTEQVDRLKRNCPWLNESSIILNNNNYFEPDILSKTKGQGVNVVINYSTGIENVTSGLNCASLYSYYIEAVQSNMSENCEIGMRPFSKCIFFIAFPKSISHLHRLQDDHKKILHEAVKEGIETGLIRPIKDSPLKASSIRIENDEDVSKSKSTSALICDGKYPEDFGFKQSYSHIIFGGEYSEESWISLIYWLKGKGATNFVILVEKFPTKQRMSLLLNRLLADKKIIVSFKPLKKLISIEGATQLLQETSKIAPIDSVFFVSLDSSPQMIHFMDTASQRYEKSIKFFSLFSGGLEEMELRRSKGLPAFVLHGEAFPKNIAEVMSEFENTLKSQNLQNSPDILYELIEKRLSNSEDKLSSLKSYLPKSIDCLEEIGHHLSGTVEFVEMTSRSPKLSQCQGVLPIFVIPSLHASEIQSLLHTLMYPVFCASLSDNCSSVGNTAAKLLEHLKQIQPLGPVTLIGETWNGTVAVELSSMIKQCGRDFRLFLLQGNPVEWKEIIKSLNLANHYDFENILVQIYGEKLRKYLSPPTQANIDENDLTLAQKNDATFIRRSLDVLKCQFHNIHNYNANNVNLENTVLFSGTVRQNITSVVSNTCDIICIKEDNYENFVRSPVITKKINKQAMFSWNV